MPVVGVCHFPNHRTVCSGRLCRPLSIKAGHSTALLRRSLRSLFPPSFRAVHAVACPAVCPDCFSGPLVRCRLFRSFGPPAIRPDLFGRLFDRCSPTAVPRPLFPDRHSLVCPFPSAVPPPIAFLTPPFVAISSCPCRATPGSGTGDRTWVGNWGREREPGDWVGSSGREFGAALRSGRGGRGRRVRGARSRNCAPPRRSAPP